MAACKTKARCPVKMKWINILFQSDNEFIHGAWSTYLDVLFLHDLAAILKNVDLDKAMEGVTHGNMLSGGVGDSWTDSSSIGSESSHS